MGEKKYNLIKNDYNTKNKILMFKSSDDKNLGNDIILSLYMPVLLTPMIVDSDFCPRRGYMERSSLQIVNRENFLSVTLNE